MKRLFCLILLGFFSTASADVEVDIDGLSVDGISNWYFHADFERMRSTESGRALYGWLEDEVFDDLEEAGIDLDRDVDDMIALSDDGGDTVTVVVNGTVRQEHKDKIMALAALNDVELMPRKAGRREYFYVPPNEGDGPFENGAYFSFALDDKYLLTSSEDEMKTLLQRGGKVNRRSSNAMIMFAATNANADGNGEFDGEWNSNIAKNTEEASVLLSDARGRLQIEAQLVTTAAEVADSLASIVRGLMALQVFNDDIEPEMAEVLKSTVVDVVDRTLSIRLSLDPQMVVDEL